MENNQQIKVGIIGLGRSGNNIHARTLATMPEQYQIAAVADAKDERLKRAAEEYGCDTYNDYHDMLKRGDLDLVVNATPSFLHVPVSKEILNSGSHCICEKPLARRTDEVDELIRTAEQCGKFVTVFQQNRLSPVFVQMRKIIDSGVLGRVVQASISFNKFARRWDWQTEKKMNGGSLLNTGPHPLDQALQLFGTDVMPEVTCAMDNANSFGDAEDYVKIILQGDKRPVIDIEISSCKAYSEDMYNVQGTLGGLSGSAKQLNWKYFDPEKAPEQKLVTQPLENASGIPVYGTEELAWHEKSWSVPEDAQGPGPAYYTKLYKTIKEGDSLYVTLEQMRQQAYVMEECFKQNPVFSVDED